MKELLFILMGRPSSMADFLSMGRSRSLTRRGSVERLSSSQGHAEKISMNRRFLQGVETGSFCRITVL